MAANLGQALMGSGGGGMVPSLAQELAAAGNFPAESRESFHDYIYSKLILGEQEKAAAAAAASTASSSAVQLPPQAPGGLGPTSNPPVFPNSNLSNSYPNPPQSAPQPAANANSTASSFIYVSPLASVNTAAASQALVAQAIKPSKKKSAPQQQMPAPHGMSVPNMNMTPGGLPNSSQSDAENAAAKAKKKSHHKKKDKTNICDVCGRGFAEKYTLNRHMLTHTNIKPYACSKCNMAFSRSDGLAKHMAAGHRRIDAHHCDVCGGTFNSEVSYEQHRREYGSTLPFVCNLCMLAFSQCCHLNYHMKSHSLAKLNDSAEEAERNNTIDVSELIPEDFAPLPKPPKPKETINLAGLLNFKAGDKKGLMLDPNITIKPEIDDAASCSTGRGGNFTLDALGNLTPSTATTSLGITGELINSSSNFDGKATSSEGGNSVAPISEADMKKYFDMKIPHPRFLEGSAVGSTEGGEEGLYRCEICGKGFTRKYHMQRHVRLHTRGPIPRAHLLDWTRRPYACGVCKMGFTRQHHLTRHMLIHTGERPHACHVCGKAFRRYTNLSLHVRTVHGAERPFKCPVCGRGFPRLYSLQRHIKLHTKEAEARRKGTITPSSSSSATGKQDKAGYSGFKAVGTLSSRDKGSTGHSSDSTDPSDTEGKLDHDDDMLDLTEEDKVHAPPPRQQQDFHQHHRPASSAQQRLPGGQTIEVVNQHSRLLTHHGSDTLNRPSAQQQARGGASGGGDFSSSSSSATTTAQDQQHRYTGAAPTVAFTNLAMQNAQNFVVLSQQQANSGGGERFPALHQATHNTLIAGVPTSTSALMDGTASFPNSYNPNPQQQQRESVDMSRNSPAVLVADPTFRHIDLSNSVAGGNDRRGGNLTLEMQQQSRGMAMDLQANPRAVLERAIASGDLQPGSGRLAEPPNYTLPQSHSGVQFAAAHTIYQQAMGDNLAGRLDLHPAQSGSPMPTSLNTHQHGTNLQY